MMSKDRAFTGRDDDKLSQIIKMINKLRKENAQTQICIDTMTKQASEEGQLLDKGIEVLRKTIAEMKLGIGSQETIKKATSGSCQLSS